jgi:hypothetical protein
MHKTVLALIAAMAVQVAQAGGLTYDPGADARAQTWLNEVSEKQLASSLATLKASKGHAVEPGALLEAETYLRTMLTSIQSVHPDALSHPGSMVCFNVYGVIIPALRESGFQGTGDLEAALGVESKTRAGSPTPETPSSSPSLESKAPVPAPGPHPASAGALETLESKDLTSEEAKARIKGLNPMLPDGTYDEPVLSSYLGVIAFNNPGLAATLMDYYRSEQKALQTAIGK